MTPTPAQLETLRRLSEAPAYIASPRHRRALGECGWVLFRGSLPWGNITDEGRQVLAKHTTEEQE